MNLGWSKVAQRSLIGLLLLSSVCLAQSGLIESSARRDIDAGNQTWVDGMKQQNAASIAATYAEDAIDCSASGKCIQGRVAIEQNIKKQMQQTGHAQSASVTSSGSVQRGDFIYEWGQAKAEMENGTKVAGNYLTVWQKQSDGSWKIFRNMVIPEKKTL